MRFLGRRDFGIISFAASQRGKLEFCCVLGGRGYEISLGSASDGKSIYPEYFKFGGVTRRGCTTLTLRGKVWVGGLDCDLRGSSLVWWYGIGWLTLLPLRQFSSAIQVPKVVNLCG